VLLEGLVQHYAGSFTGGTARQSKSDRAVCPPIDWDDHTSMRPTSRRLVTPNGRREMTSQPLRFSVTTGVPKNIRRPGNPLETRPDNTKVLAVARKQIPTSHVQRQRPVPF
jgi:hypothetical protein